MLCFCREEVRPVGEGVFKRHAGVGVRCVARASHRQRTRLLFDEMKNEKGPLGRCCVSLRDMKTKNYMLGEWERDKGIGGVATREGL